MEWLLRNMNCRRLIFFDFDGVIGDTNSFKKKCLEEALMSRFDEIPHEFVTDFFLKSGMSRRTKLESYFGVMLAREIEIVYGSLLCECSFEPKPIEGAIDAIRFCLSRGYTPKILSGGRRLEIETLGARWCDEIFSTIEIFDDKFTKADVLKNFCEKIRFFIGDSEHDSNSAEEANVPFILYNGPGSLSYMLGLKGYCSEVEFKARNWMEACAFF